MNDIVTAGIPAATEPTASAIVSAANLILNPDAYAMVERFAERMAMSSATLPAHLKKNVGDCMAVTLQALQWGMNPFAVAQKTHLVNGTLGYEAQLVNAVIQTMAPTKDRLHYEWFGPWEKVVGKFKTVTSQTKKDDNGKFKEYRVPSWNDKDEEGLGIKIWATMKGEDEPRFLELLMTQARTRNSTLWADDPKQQIAYLATKRWSRLYCPDVILGVYTKDELEEHQPARNMGAAEEVGRRTKPAPAEPLTDEQLAAWRLEAAKGKDAAQAFWAANKDYRIRATEAQKGDIWAIAVEADKKRTVDVETKASDVSGSATTTAGPTSTVDQTTGEIGGGATTSSENDDFRADLDRADSEGRA